MVLRHRNSKRASWRANQRLAAIRRWHRPLVLPKSARSLLDGLIAGDASLQFRGAQTALSITGKHAQWIRHVHRRLRLLGLKPRFRPTKTGHWTTSTKSFSALTPFYRRWYKGRRRLPDDLVVTPVLVLYWYLGDGSLKASSAELAAYAYRPSSVVRVANLLAKRSGCQVRVHYHRAGCVINIAAQSVRRFLDWIRPCPVECYRYKWATLVQPRAIKDLRLLSRTAIRQLDRHWDERRHR